MSSALYRGCPIDPSKGELRLLEITSSPDDIAFQCIFHKTLIETRPKFIALSYTWELAAARASNGNPESREYVIFINSHKIQVKENLYNFLRHAQDHKEEYRRIWVDAVCIDQNENGEKSSAVPMMGHIYPAASHVVSWLGIATPETDEVLKYANSTHFTRQCNALRYGPWQSTATERVGLVEKHFMNYAKDFTTLQRFITVLFSHRYWTRYWIVQEILLSKKLHIVCGEKKITWEKCYYALLMFQKAIASGKIPHDVPNVSEAAFTEYLLRSKGYYLSHEKKESLPLCEALLLFFHKGCKDPRDRIFALQAIISEQDKTKVDYDQSCEEVYLNATHALARSTLRDVADKVVAASGDQSRILETASQLHQDLELLRKMFVEFTNIVAKLDTGSVDEDKHTAWRVMLGHLLWQIEKAGEKVRQTRKYHDPLEQSPEVGERIYWLEMAQNSRVLEWGTRDKPSRLGPDGSYSGPADQLEEELGRLQTILGGSGDVATYIPDRNKPWHHERGED